MTNAEWIRSMTNEELARIVVNTCSTFNCCECPLSDASIGCVSNAKYDTGNDLKALEWLESEKTFEE